MHIVMTVNAAWNIWNFRRGLVEALIADGHRVTILAPPDDSVANLGKLGCRFEPLEMSVEGLNPLQDLNLLRRFRRLFLDLKPDVVLSYTIKNNIFGALAAKAIGAPFIANVTGLGTAFLSGSLLRSVAEGLCRTAWRDMPVVFFQNEDDRALFLSRGLVSDAQARLLPGSGIDLRRFSPADPPAPDLAPIFLMIGRLLRDKGVFEFVEAARRAKKTRPEARFQLLGSIDAKNRTAVDAKTVQSWVNEGVVEYLGTTSDVRPNIASASCVVLPSYREGAPRTLIEAAAMSRPVIASDVPGCRAVVERDVSGFLCAPRDAASLADAMMRFLDLPRIDRHAMGQAGRARMEREFDETNVIDAYREAIRRQAPAARKAG